MRTFTRTLAGATAVAVAVALAFAWHAPVKAQDEEEHGAHSPSKAIAVLTPTLGNEVHGTVTFEKVEDGVKVTAEVEGLTPGKHGFHIHQYGDMSAVDGTSMGGHFNPHNEPHSGPTADMRHVGDLGNLEAGDDGKATYERVDKVISLDMADPNSIIGRGVVVHAGEDDLSSQPTGDAGGRVAVGVVGVANTEN